MGVRATLPSSSSQKLSAGALGGAIVGSLIVGVLLGVFISWCFRRRPRRASSHEKKKECCQRHRTLPSHFGILYSNVWAYYRSGRYSITCRVSENGTRCLISADIVSTGSSNQRRLVASSLCRAPRWWATSNIRLPPGGSECRGVASDLRPTFSSRSPD